MKLSQIGLTDIGLRHYNADHLQNAQLQNNAHAFIVADGCHDTAESAQISEVFCDKLLENLSNLSRQKIKMDITKHAREAILSVRRCIFDNFSRKSKWVFALCITHRDFTLSAHIGDCRIIRINNSQISTSMDHSMQGRFDSYCDASELLTRVMKYNQIKQVEISLGQPLSSNEILLICSDGFWRKVEKKDVSTLVSTVKVSELFEQRKVQNSFEDNATVFAVQKSS